MIKARVKKNQVSFSQMYLPIRKNQRIPQLVEGKYLEQVRVSNFLDRLLAKAIVGNTISIKFLPDFRAKARLVVLPASPP
ncbi:MAG: hypothetical protein ABIF11_06900 [Nitrospirota bacterium]